MLEKIGTPRRGWYPPEARPTRRLATVDDVSVVQGDPFAYAGVVAEQRRRTAQAMQERTTRGLLLYNRERERIHRLDGDVWAVPSSQGGYWRVNLADETCGCQDFRYLCTDRGTGVPFMNCKHIVAAAIARV